MSRRWIQALLSVLSNRKKGNRDKLMKSKFHLNNSKNFSTVSVTVEQIAQSSCGISLIADIHKNCTDTVLSYRLWVTLSGPGDPIVVPSSSPIQWPCDHWWPKTCLGKMLSSGYESLKRQSALSNSLRLQKDKINLPVYFLNITIPGNPTML